MYVNYINFIILPFKNYSLKKNRVFLHGIQNINEFNFFIRKLYVKREIKNREKKLQQPIVQKFSVLGNIFISEVFFSKFPQE